MFVKFVHLVFFCHQAATQSIITEGNLPSREQMESVLPVTTFPDTHTEPNSF